VIAIAWTDPATAPSAWLKVIVAARNLVTIGVLVSWFATRRAVGRSGPAQAATAEA
jgi:hypothetical protein